MTDQQIFFAKLIYIIKCKMAQPFEYAKKIRSTKKITETLYLLAKTMI